MKNEPTDKQKAVEMQIKSIEDSKKRLLSKEDNKLLRIFIEVSAIELQTEARKSLENN